jgi:hypothetical protein
MAISSGAVSYGFWSTKAKAGVHPLNRASPTTEEVKQVGPIDETTALHRKKG